MHYIQARAEGGTFGAQALPFFLLFKSAPLRQIAVITVAKTKYIWIIINMTMCTKP